MTKRIEINPSVMLGKPVVRDTRIPVELILRKLAEGASVEDLLDAYPRLRVKTYGLAWHMRPIQSRTK